MNEIHDSDVVVENRVVAGQYVLEALLAETSLATFFRARDRMTLEADGSESSLILAEVSPKIAGFPAFESTLQRVLEEFDRPDSPLSIAGAYRDTDTYWVIYNESAGKTITELMQERDGQQFSPQEAQAILFNIFRAARQFMSRGGFGFLEPGAVLCSRNNCKLLNAPIAVVLRILTGVTGSANAPFALQSPYISPEVARGVLPSSQDDTFSIASIAYQLLSGRQPFGDTDTLEAATTRLSPLPLAHLGGGWKSLQQGLSLQRGKRQASPYTLLQGFTGSLAGMEDLAEKHESRVTGKNGMLAKAAVMTGLGILISYGSYSLYQSAGTTSTTLAKLEQQSPVSAQYSEAPVVEPLVMPELALETPQSVPDVADSLSSNEPLAVATTVPEKQLPGSQEHDRVIEEAIIASVGTVSGKPAVSKSAQTASVEPEKVDIRREVPAAVAVAKRAEADKETLKRPEKTVSQSSATDSRKTADVSRKARRYAAISPVREQSRQVATVNNGGTGQISRPQPQAAIKRPAPNRVVAVSPGTFVVVGASGGSANRASKKVTQVGENTFIVAID